MSNWFDSKQSVGKFRVCPSRAEIIVAIVDIARDVTKAFGEVVGFDVLRTLRRNNHDLWVFPNAKHYDSVECFGVHGRRLTLSEKSVLTGLPPYCLGSLTLAEAESALGNTIPVALVGSAIAPLLYSWCLYCRQHVFDSARQLEQTNDEC